MTLIRSDRDAQAQLGGYCQQSASALINLENLAATELLFGFNLIRPAAVPMNIVIDLDNIESWPADLRAYLKTHHDVFLGWEGDQNRPDPSAYDAAVYGLADALRPYAVIGWHCTRLTDEEAARITTSGMDLPNGEMLGQRIDALVRQGLMTVSVAASLKADHQADETYRAGRVWFCFFPPRLGDESGIGSFFRFWGGEALYRSHDRHPINSKALRAVGTPSIVEAEVPIALFSNALGLAFKIIRRYLIHRGYQTNEPYDHEDRIIQALPPDCVLRIHRFPEPRFLELSGCQDWREPLRGPKT